MPRHEQVVRQVKLLRRLESTAQGICIVDLARSGSAEYKRLRRDIEALEQANFPIVRERHDGREWIALAEHYRRHKTVPLTTTEVLALRWAWRRTDPEAAPLFDDALASLVGKLDASLPDPARAFAENLDEVFVSDRFGHPVSQALVPLLDIFSHARAERHSVDLVYRDGQGETTTRRVDPYNLWSHRGKPYLIAYCHLREAIRTFALPRMISADPTDATFEVPPDYSFDAFVSDRFRIMNEGPPETVRIWFAPEVALYVGERVWHPTQTLDEDDDGSLTLTMTVAGLVEVASWVLSFGPRAKVLDSSHLRTAVSEQLRETLDRYAGAPE